MRKSIRLKKDGGIVEVLLNRPESFNAFDLDMIELLAKYLINVAMDDSVSVLVISGEGKAFCAGGDLKWALNFPNGPAVAFHELAARYHQAILEILRMRKPVVAAVNGIAAGGGFSLALACDFPRSISPTATVTNVASHGEPDPLSEANFSGMTRSKDQAKRFLTHTRMTIGSIRKFHIDQPP